MKKYYPINRVLIRKNKRKQEHRNSHYPIYPLRENSSLKETYDYENIKDSIIHWEQYSSSIGKNWDQLMTLYTTVSDLGTKEQLNECTTIITRDIIPYLHSPSMMKKDLYKRLQETKLADLKEKLNVLVESLNEDIECDRLLTNADVISKRYNLGRLVNNNILFEDATTETLYDLCFLIDTYDMDYKSKFCIACEMALYNVYNAIGEDTLEEECLKEQLSNVSILENVLDYFLLTYGKNDSMKFLDEMQDACHKDCFIRDQLDGYIATLRKYDLEEEIIEEEKTVSLTYPNEEISALSEELDQYMEIREKTKKTISTLLLQETFQDHINKSQDCINKIKLDKSKANECLKTAITNIFKANSSDISSKGIRIILKHVYYIFITLKYLSIGNALSEILKMIVDSSVKKCKQEKELKNVLRTWKEHQYNIQRKIKTTTDNEKKRRLEAYQEQLKNKYEILEKQYTQMTSELKNKEEK